MQQLKFFLVHHCLYMTLYLRYKNNSISQIYVNFFLTLINRQRLSPYFLLMLFLIFFCLACFSLLWCLYHLFSQSCLFVVLLYSFCFLTFQTECTVLIMLVRCRLDQTILNSEKITILDEIVRFVFAFFL